MLIPDHLSDRQLWLFSVSLCLRGRFAFPITAIPRDVADYGDSVALCLHFQPITLPLLAFHPISPHSHPMSPHLTPGLISIFTAFHPTARCSG
jgi:hypothetical protein